MDDLKQLTVQEVADLLGYHRSRIYELIRAGELHARKPGGRSWRVSRAEVVRFLEAAESNLDPVA